MRTTRSRIVLSALFVAALLAVSWRAGNRQAASTDAEMRENLLQQAADIAQNINPELARRLTFAAADEGTPAFERISEQMIAGGKDFLQRGIYSMVLRDGKIFFGPENYSENDPMASPPGTEYEQPPAQLLRIFKDKHPFAEGPFTDEYGTFVSAFTPVLDPHSGAVLMVVGVDILADDWQASLNTVRCRPILITFALILILAGGAVVIHLRNRRIKLDVLKLKTWIIVPTACAILVGLILYGAYEYKKLDNKSNLDMLRITEQVRGEWNRNLASEVRLLKTEIDHVAIDPAILKAWQDKNLPSLTALAQPVLEQLKREYKMTHLYFISPDRTCFLRAHQPERRGNLIDRSTLLMAERTGEDSWGFDLGQLGTFTLRYVRPWKQDGTLIGYLELGMEIEYLVGELTENMNINTITATVIKKEYITRDAFEAGRRVFGFVGQWDDYPGFVVAHQTGTDMPGEVAHWLEHDYKAVSGNSVFSAQQGEKQFACGVIHLPDAAGRHVADIVVVRDVTTATGAAQSALLLNLCLAITLLGGVLALLWSITGTAERQLGAAFTQMRESEERLRDVTLSMDNWVWEVDQKGVYTYGSRKSFDLLGRYREEVIGKTPFDFMPADEVERIAPIFSEIVSNKAPIRDLENWNIRKDGERICLLTNGVPILDKEGNLKGYRGVDQDITERKRAEEVLRESEERYRIIMESVKLGVSLIDINHKIIMTNSFFAELFKKSAADFVGRHCFAEFEKRAAICPHCPGVLSMASGKPAEIETEGVRDDGSRFNVLLRTVPTFASDGTVSGFVEVVEDITDRKRAVNALRESREVLNAVLNSISVRVFWKDENLVYLGCNTPFARDAGLEKPEDLIGKDDYAMGWREQADLYRADDRAVIERGEARLDFEEVQTTPSGARIHLLTSKVPLRDANGAIIGLLGTYYDITERKRAEDALRASEMEHRMLFENAGVGITYCDLEGRVLMLNALAATQLGGKPEDFVGRTVVEILPSEVAAFHASVDGLTPTSTSADSENMIPSSIGPRWFSAKYTGIFEPNGVPIGVQIITMDITDRKRYEDELRKLSQAVEQSPTSVVITDLHGNIEYVNPKFCELTGYTSAEAIGQNPRILSSGLTPKETYDQMWSTIGSGHIWTGELLNLKKNGEPFWEKANISGIKDATGTIAHYIALKEDITEQKRNEEERSRFISVIDEAPESIAILNADGSIMYVNHAFEKASGISSSRAAGHYYEALARKLYANKDYFIPWDRVKTGELWVDCIAYRGGEGQFYLMDQSVSPIRSQSGEIVNYVVFNRDVTEQRELEIRARWADERLRLSIDGMVDGLTLWDVRTAPDGGVQEFVCSEANPAALMMLGKERQDAVGLTVRDLFKGAEDHDPQELFLRVHDRGRSLIIDHLHFLKDNQRLTLTIHVWPIGTGVACHLRDVTRQLELETQLRQALKLEAVGSLAAGIAHEINTPIQFVGDNIRFLADSFSGLMNVLERHRECREQMAPMLGEREELQQLRDLDKQVDIDYLKTEIPLAVEQSLEGVGRVSTIVRAMKDFSHIDEREMVLADINEMLDTTLTVARNELKYVADVAKDFAPDLPAVECFRNDLNQVFLNLLVNAAHAIGDIVCAEGQGRGTITVATRRDGDEVVVSISDTGSGIPDNIRDRIFEHFFTTKKVGKGTGQGLSIARSIIVEKHKGTITFDSVVGQGTTFHVGLPIARKETAHVNA